MAGSMPVITDELVTKRDRSVGQILFAGLTSSGWLDQAPLVALRIEEDLEGPGSVAVDVVYRWAPSTWTPDMAS